MKAIIKKQSKMNGDHFFNIYSVDEKGVETCVSCNYFSDENEKYAYDQAMRKAKLIEKDIDEIEVIVYQTPDKN